MTKVQTQFDGKFIRDGILKKIADENVSNERSPHLAVILAGDNPVCAKYVELKKKSAIKCGITFSDYLFNNGETQEEIIDCIKHLNTDDEIDGIMIQIPVDERYDRDELIGAISPEKDVDGLRYCLGLDSDFKPPVVEAILQALTLAGITNNQHPTSIKYSTFNIQHPIITIIGQGFLVGKPLLRALTEMKNKNWEIETLNENSKMELQNSDVVISAAGKANLVKPEMVKEGVVLIDAGTTEANGCLVGDIDPECYKKASFYTPVPGGIGPVTIAKLFENLTRSS